MKKFIKLLSIVMIVALCAIPLTACGGEDGPSIPVDAPTANQVMYARGFETTLYEGEPNMVAQGFGGTGAVGIIRTQIGSVTDGEYILAVYFDTAENATAVYNDMESHVGEILENWELKQQGNCVYLGTTAAIQAFEGK